MTFTDQNFTRLPFLNIRQPVLSWGPICHLSWAPELGKKTSRWKWCAHKKNGFYRIPAFLTDRKAGQLLFPQKAIFGQLFSCNFFQGISTTMHKLFHIHSTSQFGSFPPVPFHPTPICLKSTLYCTRPTFSQQQPSNPNLLLRPLGYYTNFFTEAWANRST